MTEKHVEEIKIEGENSYTCRLDPLPKPDRIIWNAPDKLEMTDADGNVHTYSLIELLDGLTALARKMKDELSNK